MLTYQPASTEQVEEFLSLLRTDAGDYLQQTLALMQTTWEQFARMVKTVGRVYAVYKAEDVVGFYWIEERGRTLHLHGIAIKAAYQGQGIATEVLTALRNEYAPSMGAIELGVHESNIRARALYERLGYQVVKHMDDLGYDILQLPLSRIA